MAYKFNGTTVGFGGDLTPLVSVDVTQTAQKIRITGSAATIHLYEGGIPSMTTVVEIVGGSALAVGATGALTVVWQGGSTVGAMANAVLIAKDRGGGLDGATTTKLTFAQTPA